MSNLQRARDLLKKITYKPGWEITVTAERLFPAAEPTMTLILTFITKDVNTGEDTRLALPYPLPPIWDGEMKDSWFIEMVWRAINKFEFHEVKEWFKIDGFCVYDPTPDHEPVQNLDQRKAVK